MIENDGKRQFVTIVGLETRPLVAVTHFNRLRDADEFLGGVLFFDPRRLDQEDERRSRTVEDGHFRRIQINPGVVDAQTAEGGHQVFDGPDLDPVNFQTGAHAGIPDQHGLGRNILGLGQIDATEDDTGIGRGRAQGHIDLDTAVQTDAGGANDGLQRALLEHAKYLNDWGR